MCIELEYMLAQKEKKIKALSNVIQLYEGEEEIFAMSEAPSDEDDDSPFKVSKMTKAEFIMTQVDLDVIESHGSAEISTVHPISVKQQPIQVPAVKDVNTAKPPK